MAIKKVKTEELRDIDSTDLKILGYLGENSRIRLIELSKKIGLSIDSIKKRIQKLEEGKVITKYALQVDSAAIGLPIGVHIYLKLKDIKEKDYENLIQTLKKDPRVINLMAMAGDYDIYIVMLVKNVADLEKRKLRIRQQFSQIIADWKEVLVAQIYKLEEYSFG
ncbi:Lrp/AsnC family transcriptional regulator [Candidatus Woesearchaeota archaeon]|nr:Lrp/AsnC family transcriptional regulator [Candidatus Woesearchaeota archaeon]